MTLAERTYDDSGEDLRIHEILLMTADFTRCSSRREEKMLFFDSEN